MRKIFTIIDLAEIKLRYLLGIIVLGFLSSYLEITPTNILGEISNTIVELAESEKVLNSKVIQLFLCFISMTVVGSIIRNLFCYCASKYANTIIYALRKKCFLKLLNVNYNYINSSDKAQIINTIYNNTGRLEIVFSTALFTLVSDVFDLIIISIYILMINPFVLFFLVAMIPFTYVGGKKSGKCQKHIAKEKIATEKDMIDIIGEAFTSIDIIRVFRGKDEALNRMETSNKKYFDQCNESDWKLSAFFVSEKTLRTIGKVAALFYVAWSVVSGNIDVGSFLVIALYTDKFYAPITNITKYFQMIQKGIASIDSIEDFLEMEDYKEYENITFTEDVPGLNIDKVTINVNDYIVRENINTDFENKKVNLLTGKSGCGKSSLIKVLLGRYSISRGSVCINASLNNCKNLFSYASQNVKLFNKTILENCIYPTNILAVSKEKIEEAKKMLNILGIPEERINNKVGEEGTELSGGEIKKIEFIRAVLFDAPILILDEITTNLDKECKEKMEEIIINESKKRCVILISHDFENIIKNCEVNKIVFE